MPPILILLLIFILIVGTWATVRVRRMPRNAEVVIPRLSKRSDKKRKQLAQLLVQWAARVDPHGVGAWMRRLSDGELNVLTKDVDLYTKDMGFDLLWVLDDQIDDPVLREHVNQTVFKYVQSFYLAAGLQDDMQLYTTLVDFLNNMGSRKYRPKADAIYRQLSVDGLIPNAEPGILFEKRAKRLEHIENAIRQTAQSNRDALKRVIRTVILE